MNELCFLCLQMDLREKLVFLDGKLSKNESVISQMRAMQNKLRVCITWMIKAQTKSFNAVDFSLFCCGVNFCCCGPHKESAIHRKSALSAGYQQMRDMMTKEENDALKAVDKEVETGEVKIRGLISKFGENVDNIGKAKEEILCLLGQSQTLAFLQVG